MKRLMGLIRFDPRSPEWWTFLVLPIILAIGVILKQYLFGDSQDNWLSFLRLHLLMYSIVLSSTDLSSWTKQILNEESGEGKQRLKVTMAPRLIVILFSTLTLQENIKNVHNYLLLALALILTYLSIWLYNHNPLNSDISSSEFAQERERTQNKYDKRFENSQNDLGIKT